MSTHPATIEGVFSAALEIASADERRAYLDRVCAGGAQLRQRVEALLLANADAGSFLHRLPGGIDATTGTSIDGRGSTDCGSASAALPLLAPCDKPDRIGKLVGKVGEYEIIEIVGQGGMGTVLRAFDTKLSRVVAVKVMAAELAASPTAVRRFLREATTAAAVVHNHVVTIHAVDDSHRPPFLVMEYIDGQTLQQKIDREGALQLKTILRIGTQAAAGLAAAHNTGLIHRDVKPGNILLENGVERVKITDFGLARAADDLEMTKAGMIAGTPQYMSPEQAKGDPVDARSDLFSLGSVLYTMCTGRPAFRAETTMGVLKRVCEDQPRPIHEVNAEMPPWLDAIVSKLLAKNLDERFQSAAEVAELLSQHLAHLQQPALHPQPAAITRPRVAGVERRSRVLRRRWSLAAAAVLLLCAGLSLAESTGVTNVAATVIRIVRGDGTLVVEVDDPNIQVLIDGEELVISGAGPKEIRLRPGQHELHTLKDGKPVETKLVTISRDGREVVKVAREELTPAGMNTRLVWADAVDAYFHGVPSRDGKYLSYQDLKSGDVGVYELATGKKRRLTNQGWPEWGDYPIFSPDSQQVAYSWMNKDKVWELRTIGLDGSGPRVLYPNKEKEVGYLETRDWSADGKNILVTFVKKGAVEIVLVSTVDGSVRVLSTPGSSLPGKMRFSPDGRYVAYDYPPQKYARQSDLFLLPTDGSAETRVVEHSANDILVGWAPDGNRLLFASDRTGSMGVWLIAVAEGKPQGAPELVKAETGQFYAMGLTRSGAFYYGIYSGGRNVYTATLDLEQGQALTPLAVAIQRGEGYNRSPAWSPDGKYLACLSFRGERGALFYIRSNDTNEVRELAPNTFPFNVHSLSWSPDGRQLLGGMPMRRVDVQTGAVNPLERTGVGLYPVLAPDGKALFHLRQGTPRRIIRRDLETGVEQELYQTSDHAQWWTLSPDGQELAFSVGGALKLLPTAGGEPRELVNGEGTISTVAWTPDGRQLLFQRVIPPGSDGVKRPELWRILAAGGEPQKLDVDLPAFEHLRIHPDGRQIAFCASSPQAAKTEVWALENFIPPLADSKTVAATSAGSAAAAVSVREQPSATEPTTRRVWAKAVDLRYSGTASPDGKYVSFIDMPSHNVAVYELDTGKTRRLSNEGGSEMGASPIFSPDGQQVAYRWTNKEKVNELRTVGIDGSQPRVLYPNTDQSITNLQPRDWSADGKSILAVFATKGGNQLVLVSVADGSVRVLKESASSFHLVVTPFPETTCLSPDGRYVAYSAAPQSTSHQRDLFLLATDGSGEVPLVEHPADDFVLGWSPDGKRLVFASDRTGSTGIWLIEVAEGKPQGTAELVKPAMGQFRAMRLTRTGSLFYGVGTGGGDVYTATLDLEQGQLLSPPVQAMQRSEGSNHNSAWSPDGRYLACTSHRQSRAPLVYIRSLESNEVRELAPDLLRFGDTSIEWSPDGRELLSLGENRDGKRGTQRLDVQTGAVTSIPTNGPRLFPALSPDGKSLFYLSQYSGRPEKPGRIQRRDLETGVEHELHQISEFAMNLTLSPDGQQLAFTEGIALKVIPTAGGHPRELAKAGGTTYIELLKGEGHIITVAWTPDGRHLVYQKMIPQHLSMLAKRVVGSGPDPADLKTELWRVPAAGGPPQQLDVALPLMMHLRIHPDGRQITFSGQPAQTVKNEIWVLENFLPPLADSKPPAAAAASATKSK